jgi:hypothetical protein
VYLEATLLESGNDLTDESILLSVVGGGENSSLPSLDTVWPVDIMLSKAIEKCSTRIQMKRE